MVLSTLTTLLLRDEAFWIAFALWFAGTLTSEIVLIRIIELDFVVNLVVLGSLLFLIRILVAIIVILYNNVRYGYEEALTGS
ncbi:hypothetical protein [Halocatena marina]|uniref:Uncharacterized protein n=1 Tax=Halocatena marina TaxID=2934937 RepID=A0ABD5YSE4_9EURY|nr:hypothetical protein [Halocatena marina]